MFNLRDYQILPVQVGIDYFKGKDNKPSLIVAPTAFGKSLLIASISNHLQEGVLVLQPSKELLEQNYSKLVAMGGEATVFSASFGQKKFGHITYGTIGSMKHLGAKFKEMGYKYLIIDEVHLYPRGADSMLGKFMQEAGIEKVLGVTATAFKLQQNTSAEGEPFSKLAMLTSKSKMGSFFKEILHVTQIREMLDKGYWSKLEYMEYDFSEKKLKYNSAKSDFTEASILTAYDEQNVGGKIMKELSASFFDRKKVLVFVPSVDEAIRLADLTPDAKAVYSGMPNKERDQVIDSFKNGKTKVIYNVNILSVGFDYAEVDCIIMARPTASLAWYYQAIGRGTRIHPLKKDCLIVDFVGNVKRFGRIEDLVYKKDGKNWVLYGSNGNQLTGIPVDEIGIHKETSSDKSLILKIGKFRGKHVKDTPDWWRKWMLENFQFDKKSEHIKEALISLRENPKCFDIPADQVKKEFKQQSNGSSPIGGVKKKSFFEKVMSQNYEKQDSYEDDLPF